MRDELTPDQAKAIVAEIDAWHQTYAHPDRYQVIELEQFYMLSEEAYSVRYASGQVTLFVREKSGNLRPASSLTYYAPSFELPKLPGEDESQSE